MDRLYQNTAGIRRNLDTQFFNKIDGEQQYSVYAPDPEELSNDILEKLEQAGRVPSKDKFRRMACNTYIYTGACPYNDRCVFLHDYRIRADGVKAKATRQTKVSNLIKDTFYWPDMSHREVISHLDSQGLADVNQRYQIPDCFGKVNANIHNRSIYSLWTHFVAFCMYNRTLKTGVFNNLQQEKYFQDSDYRENRFIKGLMRLPVFYDLSNVEHVDDHNAQLLSAEYDALEEGDSLSYLRTPVRGYEPPLSRLGRGGENYETPQGAPSLLMSGGPPLTDPASYMRQGSAGGGGGGAAGRQRDLAGLFANRHPSSTVQSLSAASDDSTISWLRRPQAPDPFRVTPKHAPSSTRARVEPTSGTVQVLSPSDAAKDDQWLSLLHDMSLESLTEENDDDEGAGEAPAAVAGSETVLDTLGDMEWDPVVDHSIGAMRLEMERLEKENHLQSFQSLKLRQPSTLSTITEGSMSPVYQCGAIIGDAGSAAVTQDISLLHTPSADSLGAAAAAGGGRRLSGTFQSRTQHILSDWFTSPCDDFQPWPSLTPTKLQQTKRGGSDSGGGSSSGSGYRNFDHEMAQLQVKLDSRSSSSRNSACSLKQATLSPAHHPVGRFTAKAEEPARLRVSYPPVASRGSALDGWTTHRSQSLDAVYLQQPTSGGASLRQAPVDPDRYENRDASSQSSRVFANRHYALIDAGPRHSPYSPGQQLYQTEGSRFDSDPGLMQQKQQQPLMFATTKLGSIGAAGGVSRGAATGASERGNSLYLIQPPVPSPVAPATAAPSSPFSATAPVQVGRYKVDLPQRGAVVAHPPPSLIPPAATTAVRESGSYLVQPPMDPAPPPSQQRQQQQWQNSSAGQGRTSAPSYSSYEQYQRQKYY